MSWEFDYKKAWQGLALPAYKELPESIHNLVHDAVVECKDRHQNKSLGMDWPEDGKLKERFMSVPKEVLAKAITVVYYYGHWYSGKHCKPEEAWIKKDYLVDDIGGYWKFEIFAKAAYIERFPGEHWEDTYKFPETKPMFYTHTKGTDMCDEELSAKYSMLVKSPLKSCKVNACNFKPHPFMIGLQHFPKDGGIYIKPDQAPCAMKGCNLSYSEHTFDKVLFVQLTKNCTKAELTAVLKPLDVDLKADKIAGIAFVKNGFNIT